MSRQLSATRFNKLIEETVNNTYDGPVPEILLYRLLTVAEKVFRQEVELPDACHRLVGLQVGYELYKDEQKVGAYWVGWGWLSMYQDSSEDAQEDNLPSIASPTVANETPDPFEFNEILTKSIQKEMQKQAAPELLAGKIIRAFVYAHIVRISPVSPILPNPGVFRLPIDGGGGDRPNEITEIVSCPCSILNGNCQKRKWDSVKQRCIFTQTACNAC